MLTRVDLVRKAEDALLLLQGDRLLVQVPDRHVELLGGAELGAVGDLFTIADLLGKLAARAAGSVDLVAGLGFHTVVQAVAALEAFGGSVGGEAGEEDHGSLHIGLVVVGWDTVKVFVEVWMVNVVEAVCVLMLMLREISDCEECGSTCFIRLSCTVMKVMVDTTAVLFF